jgi:hypothetical protein
MLFVSLLCTGHIGYVYEVDIVFSLCEQDLHYPMGRMCIPHQNYDFELLRLVLVASAHAWIGTPDYFRYMLVSKYFADTVTRICPADKSRLVDVLRVGDVVSSLSLAGSTAKHRRMCLQLDMRTKSNFHMQTWCDSHVHKFRIIARQAELKSLYTTQYRKCTWLLVPDLPWHLLFKLFDIDRTGTFLGKLRRLKRLLIRYPAFRATKREHLWKFKHSRTCE